MHEKSIPRCNVKKLQRERSAPDAPRLRAVRQRLPQQLVLGGRRQNRVVLAAETAIELGLREQGADFRLAAGGKQRQPFERASECRSLDEIGAALAEPAG